MPRCTKAVFISLVLVVPILLFIVFPRVSLRSITDSVSAKLSQKLYNAYDPGYRIDPSASPDLIVRSVYLDDRPRNGFKTSLVFLVEVRKSVLKGGRIVACAVDDHRSSEVKVHTININGWVGNYVDEKPYLSHTMALVDCYGLPAQNGTFPSLHYKRINDQNAMVLPASSLRPLILVPQSNSPSVVNSTHSYKIAACIGVVYGKPQSQLGNWLRYQQTIGVDHVHMIVDDSFVANRGLEDGEVKKYLGNSFLSVDVWKRRLRSNIEIQYHSQMLAYHDCIYQFRTRYEYMIFTDQDDFFVPLVPGQKSLHYYIDRWCYKGSCAFEWTEYYPDCGMKAASALDGNLTSLLLSDKHKKTPYKKCLHRLSAMLEIGIHDAREVVSGYHAVEVPGDMAYVAHIRQSRRPPGRACR